MQNLSCGLPLLLTTFLLIGCNTASPPADARLQGTFVSNKDASMAFLESTGQYDAKQMELFGDGFGKMEVSYKGKVRTTVMDGQTVTHNFTVVDSGPDHITIECKWSQEESALMGEDSQIHRIEFTDDGFWLGNSNVPMDKFKEKFVRKN